jgi:hypothetical protein
MKLKKSSKKINEKTPEVLERLLVMREAADLSPVTTATKDEAIFY